MPRSPPTWSGRSCSSGPTCCSVPPAACARAGGGPGRHAQRRGAARGAGAGKRGGERRSRPAQSRGAGAHGRGPGHGPGGPRRPPAPRSPPRGSPRPVRAQGRTLVHQRHPGPDGDAGPAGARCAGALAVGGGRRGDESGGAAGDAGAARSEDSRGPAPSGQIEAADLMRRLLADSEIRESHREGDPRVQDAYSLRCAPQVLGAVADAIRFAAETVEVELNASTDNPLVFPDGEVISGGNFHGQPVAQALDILALTLTTLQAIAERRVERLVNPDLSQGLPAFLTRDPGLCSGYMMVQITAASLVAESRALAMPASIGSIPTDANQEDFVPMGMAAAYKAQRILANARRVVGAELLCAAQGLEFLRPLRPGRGSSACTTGSAPCSRRWPCWRPTGRPAPDLERLARAVADGELDPGTGAD